MAHSSDEHLMKEHSMLRAAMEASTDTYATDGIRRPALDEFFVTTLNAARAEGVIEFLRTGDPTDADVTMLSAIMLVFWMGYSLGQENYEFAVCDGSCQNEGQDRNKSHLS